MEEKLEEVAKKHPKEEKKLKEIVGEPPKEEPTLPPGEPSAEAPFSLAKIDNHRNYLQVFFTRDDKIVEKNKAYREVIFNHVGLYLPYNGIIWEQVGSPFGFPQESSDKYYPKNAVRIILPVELAKIEGKKSVSEVCEANVEQWANCTGFVCAVLKDLEILGKVEKINYADDLYFRLKGYTHAIEDVVKHYRNNR